MPYPKSKRRAWPWRLVCESIPDEWGRAVAQETRKATAEAIRRRRNTGASMGKTTLGVRRLRRQW